MQRVSASVDQTAHGFSLVFPRSRRPTTIPIGSPSLSFCRRTRRHGLDSAVDASMRFAHDGRGDVLMDESKTARDPDRASFLMEWLFGTEGGREALGAWMAARNIVGVKDDLLYRDRPAA